MNSKFLVNSVPANSLTYSEKINPSEKLFLLLRLRGLTSVGLRFRYDPDNKGYFCFT